MDSSFSSLGEFLDILAISCDSFCEETNFTIGRRQGSKNHLTSLKSVQRWCQQYKVAFKINTVVNVHNLEENMTEEILDLSPIRWKVQVCNDLGLSIIISPTRGTAVA